MSEAEFQLRDVYSGSARGARLFGVTVDLAAQGITVLVGASGSGKSSLLRLLNRLDAPSAGTVRWCGTDLGDVDVLAHRREVGMVFQEPRVASGTVADNLRLGASDLEDDSAAELLTLVSLDPDFLERDATALSVGERQRVCLARTLATGPRLILADELTSSLDPESTEAIESLAKRLCAAESLRAAESKGPLGWIWVSHDPGQARRLAQRLVVMAEGKVAASGTASDLFASPDRTVRMALGGDR